MCGRLELGSPQNNRKWLEDMVTHTYFMVDVKVEEGPDLAKRFHNYRAAQRKGEDVDWWSAQKRLVLFPFPFWGAENSLFPFWLGEFSRFPCVNNV